MRRQVLIVFIVVLLTNFVVGNGTHTYVCTTDCSITDNTVHSWDLVVTGGGLVQDLDVELVLEHTYLGDLMIYLEGPQGARTLLARRECGTNDNADVVFDDAGSAATCFTSAPGNVLPESPLANFIGVPVAGVYTLTIEDRAGGDVGQLIRFSLIFGGPEESNFPPIVGAPHFFGPSADATWYMYMPGCMRVHFSSAVDNMAVYLASYEGESSVYLGDISGGDNTAVEREFTPRQIVPGRAFLVGEADGLTVFSESFQVVANSAFATEFPTCSGSPAPTDSCFDSCGGRAPSGCYCDQLCEELGDCCPDYCSCGFCNAVSCNGRCSDDLGACSCTPGCEYSELGCCFDVCDVCPCGIDEESCAGRCGSNDGPCGCGPGCQYTEIGCCDDVCDECPLICGGGSDSCVGFCGDAAPAGCWCDNICALEGDCCPDVCDVCGLHCP